jgi:hypothetical protein
MGSSPCGHKGHSLPLVLRSEVALELFGGFHPNSCRSQPCSVVSSRLAKQYCKFDANGLLQRKPCTDRCRLIKANPRDICCQRGTDPRFSQQCLEPALWSAGSVSLFVGEADASHVRARRPQEVTRSAPSTNRKSWPCASRTSQRVSAPRRTNSSDSRVEPIRKSSIRSRCTNAGRCG